MTPRDPKFAALYTQHAAHVWRVARHFGVGCEQLEDITQEVWLSVLGRIAELDVSRSPRAWLTAVVWNHVRHARRGQARRMRKAEALTLAEATRRGDEPAVLQKEAAWTLERLLADLPEEQRQVLLLCDGEGLTGLEVSAVLGIKPNTVSSRLRLARRRCEALVAGGAAVAALLHDHCFAMTPSQGQLDGILFALANTSTSGRLAGTTGASKLKFAAAMFAVAAGCFAVVTTWSASAGGWAARGEPPASPPPSAVLAPAPATTPPQSLEFAPAAAAPPPPPPSRAVASRRSAGRKHLDRRDPVAPIPSPPPPTPPPPLASLAAEHRILAEAAAALANGYTDQALAHLAEHRRDFPRGASAQARDLLRIRTYCARHNVERARHVALERPHDPQFAALAARPCG